MKFDFLVIGGGSGGIACARRAAMRGAKVGLIEKGPLGGTCVNVGCVPKKVMWNSASLAESLHDAKSYGFNVSEAAAQIDWSVIKQKRDSYVKRLNGIYEKNLANSEVTYIAGHGRFKGPGTVEVDGQDYTAEHILIAVGGRPRSHTIPGAELGIDSNGFFELEQIPKKLVIAGSGYIAVELAGVMRGLGVEVDLLVRRERVLRSFDNDLGNHLMEHMRASGINIHLHTEATSVEKSGEGLRVSLNHGDPIETDQVLWALGRDPLTSDLGLETIGLPTTKSGTIEVDSFQNTSVKGVYAVGDVIGKIDLTPVAIAAGRRLAERLFGNQPHAMLDYDNVASVIFTHPPIGTVGLSYDEAVKTYGEDRLKVYQTAFTDMFYAPCDHKPKTFMKLICLLPSERVIGAHVIGRGADEMMQGFGVAVKMGATKADFDATVAIHPVASEEFVTMT